MTNLLPPNFYSGSPSEPSAVHHEVLLTYRLLFGQSARARKLLKQQLNGPSQPGTEAAMAPSYPPTETPYNRTQNFSESVGKEIDPFLHTVCTTPLLPPWQFPSFTRPRNRSRLLPGNIFPASALDLHDELQESDTYSVRDNFPVFGSRLLKLQKYNMRQQPSKVKDMWRDRLNPLQWDTFWAVLWIGGATIVLAGLQLLVAIAQLIFAI